MRIISSTVSPSRGPNATPIDGADEQTLLAIEERPLQRADQGEAELLQLLAAHRLGNDDRELVAAEPARGHLVGNHRLEAARDLLQQMVAGDVAEAVVDRLEPVEVDQQHRALGAAGLGLFQGRGQIVHAAASRFGRPVRASCRAIWAMRSAALASRGHVRTDAMIADEAALLVEGRPGRKLDRPCFARRAAAERARSR